MKNLSDAKNIFHKCHLWQILFLDHSFSNEFCALRESSVGVRHHSPQSEVWASTIPVRSKVKISRKTCPMLRRKDSIHYGINGSLSIKVQEQGSMHHRPVQQLQSGQSFSQRSKHAGHSLYLYLHFLSIWPFPPPPHLPNGHFGAFYTPIDLGKQFVYNVIGSQKVAMVLAFEPNFLQNLIFLKQD